MKTKKILFITGTRADFGKIKSLIRSVENDADFEAYVYVSGMHLLETFGYTYHEVQKENYKNVYVAFGTVNVKDMSYNLGDTICNLSGYVSNVRPDMIVVHGDRIDALAGAVVGAFHNIRVAHIEGGELSGTIDESTRHAISKFAHLHLVCNQEAKKRLIQMGEEQNRIFVIGSPDIDVMMSDALPSLEAAKERYKIHFSQYGIFMYHPVTTEYRQTGERIKTVIDALIASQKNYIVVYPNNDLGSEIILNELKRIENNSRFCVYPSLRFEYFLTLLRHALFMIGNSSAGIRETCIYGIPSIDIGTRQQGRYSLDQLTNIQHVSESADKILSAIGEIENHTTKGFYYGDGNSTKLFMEILKEKSFWDLEIQKHFVDMDML